MAEFFEQPPPEGSHAGTTGAGAGQAGRRISVVLNANLWQVFDYLWPEQLGQPQAGQRVHVPFGRGNRKNVAFVADTERSDDAGGHKHALKSVLEVVDPQSHFDATMWKLANWMSHYYMTPLGMVLAAMIPSAVGRHASRNETVVFLASERADWPASLGARQKRALDELYEARKQGIEPLTMEALLAHSGATRHSAARLEERKLVRTEVRAVQLAAMNDAEAKDPFDLNEEQKRVMEQLEPALKKKTTTAKTRARRPCYCP